MTGMTGNDYQQLAMRTKKKQASQNRKEETE